MIRSDPLVLALRRLDSSLHALSVTFQIRVKSEAGGSVCLRHPLFSRFKVRFSDGFGFFPMVNRGELHKHPPTSYSWSTSRSLYWDIQTGPSPPRPVRALRLALPSPAVASQHLPPGGLATAKAAWQPRLSKSQCVQFAMGSGSLLPIS